jgi:hypothetical protein
LAIVCAILILIFCLPHIPIRKRSFGYKSDLAPVDPYRTKPVPSARAPVQVEPRCIRGSPITVLLASRELDLFPNLRTRCSTALRSGRRTRPTRSRSGNPASRSLRFFPPSRGSLAAEPGSLLSARIAGPVPCVGSVR